MRKTRREVTRKVVRSSPAGCS